jgi:hypothetical protein
MAPSTYGPTSSPISADDEINNYFCGSDLEEANELCGQWCRDGEDTSCPEGQKCFKDTSCNATELNMTIGYDESLISEVPSIAPTTYRPTEDLNPSDYYCFEAWTDSSYDGDCGLPCPGGLNSECPTGQYCYGPIPDCNPIYKVGVSDKWCGSTFEDMASKCSKECPGGSDDECGEGEKCWSDSPCALKKSAIADLEALEGKLWCGKNYKDLVENCPMECPGGSDDECDGDMICFDMSTEEMACNETGVGIKDPVDPLHLWCGSTWNNVLEECPMPCPEGTDEECGAGMICYDLTGNDKICRTQGIGVKEKGDPNKRWCGSDYNDMMSSCPRRCPGGSNDECPLGMSCFEGSDCVTEGVGLISKEEKDTSKMFCGSDYTEAMSCGTPCSSGSNDECPSGQTCWADVECLWGAQAQTAETVEDASGIEDLLEALMTESTVNADVEVEIDDQESETNSQTSSSVMSAFSEVIMEQDEEPAAQALESAPTESAQPEESQPEQSQPETDEFEYPTETESSPDFSTFSEVEMPNEAEEEFDYPTETDSSPDWSMFTEVEMSEEEFDYPTESEVAPEPQQESQPEPQPQEESQPEPQPQEEPQPQPQPQPQPEPEPSPKTGLQVENIRMALYGITQLTSDHVNAWESLTEEYFERFYNDFSNDADATRSGVTDVDTIYELTQLSVSTSSRRGLRQRVLSDSDAYLMEYTQTTRFLSGTGVTLEQVLQYPFSSSRKRSAYVQFLKNSNDLFEDLVSISAVFLPTKVEAVGSANSFSPSNSGNPFGNPTSSSSSSGNPFGDSSSAPVLDKFASFYCHNSGEACPSGSCPNDDMCIFVSASEPVPVGSYSAPPGSDSSDSSDSSSGNPSSNEAANIIEAFLGGASLDDSGPLSSNSSPNSAPTTTDGMAAPSGSSNTSPNTSSSSAHVSTDEDSGTINVSTDIGSGSISITSTADSDSTSINISSDSSSSSSQPVQLSYSDASHGPTTVKGEMTLTGLEMTKVENIFEWQYLTSLYEQEFYNKASSTGDYVRDTVDNVATSFEIIEVHYGADSSEPITVIKFKQVIKYDTSDMDIPVTAIVTQPFLTSEYRDEYITYLKQMLPTSFGSLTTSSDLPENVISQTSPPAYKDLSDTFFCGESWPVDCATAKPCKSGDMCPYGETCFTAPMCLEQESDSETAPVLEESNPMSEFSASASTAKPVDSIAASIEVEDEDDEEIYPESTYFCGMTIEDASRTCGMPCPTREDDSCPGEMKCFGDTHCEDRESFFCGTSWLDASDKCSTPCPDGDASVCGDGEACFAWTACLNTQSYYCGVSFEDASDNCAHPCESRSSLDCPDGMGCFAYTTCTATNENAEHVVNPSNTPMGDFFCGLTVEDAATKCATGGAITCSNADDTQCPGEMKCFETTECSDRSTYFCGSTWMDAAETCSKPCSSGSSDECGENESCFAHTGCQATNSFYCGHNFEDASETCGTPCEDRSSDSCPGDQYCFAYVSSCVEDNNAGNDDGDMDISYSAFGDFSEFESKEEPWVASYWAGIEASSSSTPASIAFTALASLSVLLYIIF